jgi:RHS repeat-associated protein
MRVYTQTYTYDDSGNLTQMKHVAGAGNWTRDYTYAPGRDQLATTQVGAGPTFSYPHDSHGNMLSLGGLGEVLSWNHRDELASYFVGTGEATYYQYDASGQRVRKYSGANDSNYSETIYLGGFEVVSNVSGGDETRLETLYVSDGQSRVCTVERKTWVDGLPSSSPVNWRYQVGNHLGSVSVELDEAGEVISYEEYHPYGSTSYRSHRPGGVNLSLKRYRFTGKERDDESGLYYHGARYYAAWLGRWTAADPIGIGDGLNRFAYVRGNPVGLTDPQGTRSSDETDGPAIAGASVDRFGLQGLYNAEILSAQTNDDGTVGVTLSDGSEFASTHEEISAAIEGDEEVAAEKQFNQDREKLKLVAGPGSHYEDMPAHFAPYLRDQTAGIQDPYLQSVGRSQQGALRGFGRFAGDVRFWAGILGGALGASSEIKALEAVKLEAGSALAASDWFKSAQVREGVAMVVEPSLKALQTGRISYSNQEVRLLYKAQDAALINIDRRLQNNGYGLRQRAELIFNFRNKIREESRMLMDAEELANLVSQRAKSANAAEHLSFDEFIADKMARKNISYSDALRDTIQSSARSNPAYDKKAGL